MSLTPDRLPPVHAGLTGQVRVLVQPDDGVASVIDLIGSARRRLLVKQFTLTHPALVDALIGAAGRGVLVRVMLNPQRPDATRTNDAIFARLQAAGIAVAWSSPAFAVTHEKSMVVDDAACLIATFNFAEKYFSDTRDYGLVVAHPAEIGDVAACFGADWDRTAFHPAAGTALLWSNLNARPQVAGFIDAARHRLDIQHPKFVDTAILDRITDAAARGVHVRVLCGGRHGVRAWDLLDTMSSLRLMRRAGVRIHKQTNHRLHAKLMIADEARALVGSMNIHHRAYDERRELGAVVADAAAVARLCRVFDADWEASRHYDPPDPLLPHAQAADDFAPDDDIMHD